MADLSAERRIYDTGVTSGRAVLPPPPAMWSYSSLKEVETCPRRYALSRADYPELWDQHGYPRTPIPAAIKGDVVHGSLEVIVRALVESGCLSTRSAEALGVLRELGGYTAIAERVLDAQLARFESNPRLSADRRQHLARTLNEWLPEAREQIQTYLSRMELSAAAALTPTTVSSDSDAPPARYPAGPGDHPERELVADDLRIRGRVDLLKVTTDGVTITDFKTGVEDPAHHDQLRFYALLWKADTAVNPTSLPVVSLVAAHPSHEVAVPVPDAEELEQLTSEVSSRVGAAHAEVTADEPRALVGDHCGLCGVRALCDTYWTTGAPGMVDVPDGSWCDLQGTVLREHGVKSWVLRESQNGREVLIRTPAPSVALPVGSTIRILGLKRTVDPEDQDAVIAALTNTSEIFVITE